MDAVEDETEVGRDRLEDSEGPASIALVLSFHLTASDEGCAYIRVPGFGGFPRSLSLFQCGVRPFHHPTAGWLWEGFVGSRRSISSRALSYPIR